jgi:DNA-binding NarL/FixJ family response regulator
MFLIEQHSARPVSARPDSHESSMISVAPADSLSARARALYRNLARTGPVPFVALASLSVGSPEQVRSAAVELTGLGLLKVDHGQVVAVPYADVIDQLLAQQARFLKQALNGVQDAQRRLRTLIRESRWLGGDESETVTSAPSDQGHGYMQEVRTRPQQGLAAIHPGARFPQEVLDSSLERAERDLRVGIALRVVHQSSALAHPQSMEYLRQIERLGAHVRLRENLPFRLMLMDDDSAVCALPTRDADDDIFLLRGVRLIGLLNHVFRAIWVDAVPLALAVDRRPATKTEAQPVRTVLTPQQQAIIRYLAEGETDQAIARQLGVTTRTVTRRLGEIYDALGARSRFQAGMIARSQGLI